MVKTYPNILKSLHKMLISNLACSSLLGYYDFRKLIFVEGPLREIEIHRDHDLTITTLPQSSTHLLPFERSRFDKGHGLFSLPFLRKICFQVPGGQGMK